MPFIPGKLKPRIKPRLGARVVGGAETVDQLKNKPEDQNTSLESSIPKHVEGVSPTSSYNSICGSPSIDTTNTPQVHFSQVPITDELKSEIESSQIEFNKDHAPLPRNFGDSSKAGELDNTLAKSGDEKSLGASSVDVGVDEQVDNETVIPDSSSIAGMPSLRAVARPAQFSRGQNLETSKDKYGIIIGQSSEAALVEGNTCGRDKNRSQFTAKQPNTGMSSVDDNHESNEPSSDKEKAQKRNLENIGPVSLKFHKADVEKLARPLPTISNSRVDQPVLSSDASPKPIGEEIKRQIRDQELSCSESSNKQPEISDGNPRPLIELSVSSSDACSETGEESPAGSSSVSFTTDISSEKIISLEKPSSVSVDTAAESVYDTSKIMKDTQPLDSNSGSENTKPAVSTNDQYVFKKPRMFKRPSILKPDRAKPRADNPKMTVDERESAKVVEVATASQENTDAENATAKVIPVVDMTIDRNSIPTSPLSAVNVNTKNSSSTDFEKKDVSDSDSRVPVNPTVAPKTAPPLKTVKSTKGETDDVRVLFAISAVDYLKRHDHALGDSILRNLIIGDKNMENRSRKPTMCSTCNPQTLKKCLSSLWSFDKHELQTIIKKAAERHKTPITHASLPGKTLFKPSLGRQRAPTLTASTYGKMSFEVKERLAKQYGANPPQLNKLRMLDLIFYNPSDNPMSQPSKTPEHRTKSESDLDGRKSEACKAESIKDSDSDSDPDDPSEENDVKESFDSKMETNDPIVPVPQVRIGDEGQIILAPESLVMKKKESEVMNSPVVEEYSFSDSNRKKASLDRTTWSFEETLQFYKALHSLGTDFSMMNEMFPKRTRANLKSKFKREERKNPALIDKVLAAQGQALNFADVEKDLTADKTLRRLGLDSTGAPACRKNSMKKPWPKEGLNPGSDEKQVKSSNLSSPTSVIKESIKSEGNEDKSTSLKNSDEEAQTTSLGTTDKNEDAIFKRPSNIRPPRKRKPVKSVPVLPEKRKKTELTGGKGSKESTDKGEDAIFKKPRIPKKRKAPPSSSSKRPNSPAPVQHILSISLNDEEEESDDTDDSASLDEADDECLIIKTDIKGHNYSYSRSVKVHIADPEVPIEWNETIEHDRPQTPMSDSMSETDTDSEVGEDVEVVSIDVSEIASFLEKTGAVVLGASQANDTGAGDVLPVTNDAVAEDPVTISPHESTIG